MPGAKKRSFLKTMTIVLTTMLGLSTMAAGCCGNPVAFAIFGAVLGLFYADTGCAGVCATIGALIGINVFASAGSIAGWFGLLADAVAGGLAARSLTRP